MRRDIDPEGTAAWLTWMGERGLYQLISNRSEDEVETSFNALAGIFWNALYDA